MKRYLSTEQKAKQLGLTKTGLEFAIKKGRLFPAVIVGIKTKGFEPEQELSPQLKRGRKPKPQD